MKKTISGEVSSHCEELAIAGHGAFAVKTIPWGRRSSNSRARSLEILR